MYNVPFLGLAPAPVTIDVPAQAPTAAAPAPPVQAPVPADAPAPAFVPVLVPVPSLAPADATAPVLARVSPDASHGSFFKDPLRLGFGIDIGIPSGMAAGFVVNPKLDWVRGQLSLTYDYFSFGGRASIQVDPMAAYLSWLPVGAFFDLQGGVVPVGSVAGQGGYRLGYDYLNLYGALRVGKPNGFHWNFEVGPTLVHVTPKTFLASAETANGNPLAGMFHGSGSNGSMFPTFETGCTVVF